MNYTIKARQTEYKGILFRSRIEAIWANWFDRNGIEYKYEPCCKMSASGKIYTPDFAIKLRETLFYIEIKPATTFVSMDVIDKILEFSETINTPKIFGFFILCGHPEGNSAIGYVVNKRSCPMVRFNSIFDLMAFWDSQIQGPIVFRTCTELVNKKMLQRAIDKIKEHPGTCPIFVRLLDRETKSALNCDTGLKACPSISFIKEMDSLYFEAM